MFNRIKNYTVILATSLFFIVACKEDVNEIQKFASTVDVTNSTLKDDKYSMTLLFSTDDGTTWVDYPILKPGQTYMAKVLNQKTGNVITTADDFEFDWSKSDPSPIGDAAADVAKFTSNKVNSIKVAIVSHLCPYNASSWTGDWGGDEVGACCGGTDANTIVQDGTDPNKFIMDNFWGDGVDAYFILTPSSTSIFDQVLTMPQQVTSEGGIAVGTGTYDQCAGTFTIATKYTFPGLTNLQVQAFTVSTSSDLRIYAATSSGVFTSSNGGGSWTLQSTALATTPVLKMVATGTKVFATTANGVLYSANRGLTWSTVNAGLTDTNITALVLSGANVFAGTNTGGVFLSSNNGTSWTPVNTGLTNTSITSLAVSGSDLYVGTKGGAFYSNNNGTSWTPIAANITNTFISLAASGSNLYAGTSSGLLYSADKGATWTSVVSTGLTNANVTLLTAAGASVYAGTPEGVFYSANNGANWASVNKGLASSSIVSLIAAPTLPTKIYVATSDAGAFNTTNAGTSWSNLNNGTDYVFQYNFHR